MGASQGSAAAEAGGRAEPQRRTAVLPPQLAALYRPRRGENPPPDFWGLAGAAQLQQMRTRRVELAAYCTGPPAVRPVEGTPRAAVAVVTVRCRQDATVRIALGGAETTAHLLGGTQQECASPHFDPDSASSAAASVTISADGGAQRQVLSARLELGPAPHLRPQTLRVAGSLCSMVPLYGLAASEPCCVCLDAARDTAFLPCGHFATCADCGDSVLRLGSNGGCCAVCRARASRLITLTD
eukprot:TRINITY_DN50959_c0_g1_i1.p1 TRINITY_DN50959_c0_g1~~TRINITY_DN50959_c0_g1_i1.p1  ORF type:complete len:268 (+),score=64.27 TRINITY_DN50959_c0_g1_i1:83-805(+)